MEHVAAEDSGGGLPTVTEDGRRVDRAKLLAAVESRLFARKSAPVTLGRYTLKDSIGRGGFGIVYRGEDPVLRRPVAIKLLRSRRRVDNMGGPEALMHEARMTAQLDHPNVVRVFDVGSVDDSAFGADVFIVMELLAGDPLPKWLASKPAQPELLQALFDVGEGLAAAHARGIVHCDVKPANVFRTQEHVTKVLDFGLSLHSSQRMSTHTRPSSASDEEAAPLVAGTPRYMAPEAHEGEPLLPASDQFSFAVMALEALAGGESPFRRGNPDALYRAKLKGIPDAWFRKHTPRRLIAPLKRALDPDPERRHRGLPALLDELRHGSRPSRTVPAAAVVTVLAASGIAWGAHKEPTPCPLDPGHARQRWTEARTTIQQRWQSSAVETVRGGQAQFDADIEAFVEAWTQTAETACEASPTETPTSRCLEGGLAQLDAVFDTMARADDAVLSHALGLSAQLESPEACLEPSTGHDRPAPFDPQHAQEAARIREMLSRVHTQYLAGRHDRSAELGRLALQQAASLGFEPVLAEALLELGLAEGSRGKLEAAADSFEQAYLSALGSRYDRLTAESAIRLASVHGVHLRDTDRGRAWARQATSALSRVPEAHSLHALLVYNEGLIAYFDGEFDQAQALLEQAHQQYVDHGNTRDATDCLYGQGMVATRQGDHARALALFERVHTQRRNELGLQHPATSFSQSALASAQTSLGMLQRSRANYRDALTSLEHSLGAGHPDVATTLGNLGTTELRLGAFEDGREHFQRAFEVLQRTLPADHPRVVTLLDNLATAESNLGLHEKARERQAEVLEKRLATLPPEHQRVIRARTSLAMELAFLGRGDEAREQIALALPHLTLEMVHANDLLRIAVARRVLGEHPVADFENLIELLETDSTTRSSAQFELAQVLVTTDRKRSESLASTAADTYRRLGVPLRVEEIDTWKRQHGMPP